jgi:N-carbamoylputrescine amidase
MRVTVCELNDAPDAFARDWEQLVDHVKSASSQLVLLQEMALCPWFAIAREFAPALWEHAVAAHNAWLARLTELAPAIVLGSRPVNQSGLRLNQEFVGVNLSQKDDERPAAPDGYPEGRAQ